MKGGKIINNVVHVNGHTRARPVTMNKPLSAVKEQLEAFRGKKSIRKKGKFSRKQLKNLNALRKRK